MMISIFRPESENNHMIVIGQGAMMEQSLYNNFADFLAGSGYTIISFSYRGLDKPEWLMKKKAEVSIMHWAMQDLDAALLFARHRYPAKELIFLAHGLSGEIAGISAASTYINRMIMISSGLTCSRLRPLRIRILLFLMKRILPVLIFLFGYYPGKKLRYLTDLPAGVIREWSSWCSNENGLFDDFPDNNYCRLRIPVLSISFAGNPFLPEAAIRALLSRYSNANIRWVNLPKTSLKNTGNDENAFFASEEPAEFWNLIRVWLESEASYNGYFNQQEKMLP